PTMKVAVIAPEDYMGDVIGDLNSRRGQIQGMEARSGAQQIDALVPLSEMFGYATDLRSRTQGRGQYSMEPHSYVEVPKNIAEKIIAQRGRDRKSTRLNSSHVSISYAVFCLKKKIRNSNIIYQYS